MSPHIETPVANCCVFAQRPRKKWALIWHRRDKAKISSIVVWICKRLQLSIVLTGDLKDGLSKNGLSSDFWFSECHPNIDQSLFIKSLKDTRRNTTKFVQMTILSLNYPHCDQGSLSFILMTSNLLCQPSSLPCQTFQSGWVQSTQQGQLWRQPKDTHRLQDSLHYLRHRWWWWWSPMTMVAMVPMLKKMNNITLPFPSFPPCPPRHHHRRRLPLSPRQVNQIATQLAGGLKKYALVTCPRLSLLAMFKTSKSSITF